MSGQYPDVVHPKFRMWLPDDGIVRLVWSPPVPSGREDAIATIEAMIEVTGDRPAPLLVDVRDAGPQDREGRLEFHRRYTVVSAVAILVGSPLSRMMGNFFVNVNKPKAPTRLFDDEAAAVEWLKGFLG